MDAIVQEIATQPAAWGLAERRAASAGTALPAAGEQAVVVGCGTSWHVAQAYAAARERAGLGRTEAFPASEVPDRRPDVLLAISRSGTTTEVVRALAGRDPRVRATAISATGTGPVVDQVDAAIVLDFADERSVVQTRFATSALALLRASIGADLGPVVADGRAALAAELPFDPGDFEQFVFLGHEWTVGLAYEAALKLREAARAWAEAYPALEYRHGPISVAGPHTAVWFLGGGDPDLCADIAATGARVVTGDRDAMAELVLAQRVAVELARRRGLDPDHPRFLTRSVVLDGAPQRGGMP